MFELIAEMEKIASGKKPGDSDTEEREALEYTLGCVNDLIVSMQLSNPATNLKSVVFDDPFAAQLIHGKVYFILVSYAKYLSDISRKIAPF